MQPSRLVGKPGMEVVGQVLTAQGRSLLTSPGLSFPTCKLREWLDDLLMAALRGASLAPMGSYLCHLSFLWPLPCGSHSGGWELEFSQLDLV